MFENISHDFRVPFKAIRSTVDYLKQRNIGDSPDINEEELV